MKNDQTSNKNQDQIIDSLRQPWIAYEENHRAAQMKIIAHWIENGMNGSVIGPSGSGKSNLLGFLCHRPEVLPIYFTEPNSINVLLIPIDLNDLPARDLATSYRVILRSFYEIRMRFMAETQQHITQAYFDNCDEIDPFLAQSAVRELITYFQARGDRVVFVIDHFDAHSSMITPEMGNTLRSLWDSFKTTLSYVVGIRQHLSYLEKSQILGSAFQILDTNLCYMSIMSREEAHKAILRDTKPANIQPSPDEMNHLLNLTGGYPSLIKVVGDWWLLKPNKPESVEWRTVLFDKPAIQHRLEYLWQGLTQGEQNALATLHETTRLTPTQLQHYKSFIQELEMKKLIYQNETGQWHIFSQLFEDYVGRFGGSRGGKIWLDPTSDLLYQNQEHLQELTPTEESVLRFLLSQPRKRHTYTDIINAVWLDDETFEGVSTESLQQMVRGLRKKIEPVPSTPSYIINWRGKPEGGYQFFPEGKPT